MELFFNILIKMEKSEDKKTFTFENLKPITSKKQKKTKTLNCLSIIEIVELPIAGLINTFLR